MFGPLAPFISKQFSLSPSQSSFLVAVPVLAASVIRVTFGNLFKSVDGRRLALLGIALSAIPACVLVLPVAPTYTLMLVLGIFLGVGGASFAIALPMAGSSYPPRVQGLVLGLAAAGNIGAVVDGFLFPGLAQRWGWVHSTLAVLPLLALTAVLVFFWAEDRTAKSGSGARACAGFAVSLSGLSALVLLVNAGVFGHGKTGLLLLPVLGLLLALTVLPRKYLAVLAERDTWVVMFVYSITFGGFVGMSSYVSLLLTTQYLLSKVDAGVTMALLACTGALLRPIGGFIADRLTGVMFIPNRWYANSIDGIGAWPSHGSDIASVVEPLERRTGIKRVSVQAATHARNSRRKRARTRSRSSISSSFRAATIRVARHAGRPLRPSSV
jgi:MFS transporter, NNP family, nitrate/nitrite transporter